ncbi:phosphatase domain-containing protein [Actinomycetospora flava]|uniref:Polynucleotide kinase PNKP phosphatase domain-containing protein n=1 Tax=Actinomycetospora flava TaxID=3129232 RepID=A0ABU8MH55_9PSEU
MTREARTVAALDIDGVVADVRHRLHLVTPDTWAEFFAAATTDPLLEQGAALAHRLAARHRLVWVTGRPERTRGATQAWLDQHGLPPGRLLMHPERSMDPRSSREVKAEQLGALRDAGEHIAVVVDDDARTVATLRADGFHCLLAQWSPYSPTYQDAEPVTRPGPAP